MKFKKIKYEPEEYATDDINDLLFILSYLKKEEKELMIEYMNGNIRKNKEITNIITKLKKTYNKWSQTY